MVKRSRVVLEEDEAVDRVESPRRPQVVPAAAPAAPPAAARGGEGGQSREAPRSRRDDSEAEQEFAPPDADTFRILISTDNHLGYLEEDPVRGRDSFRAFEEVMDLAVKRKVDFVLLGGDLFHHNKPSRSTVLAAADIIRSRVLGSRPVSFQVVSDQSRNFPHSEGVNYEDPNISIALPVFIIHGNHDDPTGTDKKSAIDLLSAARLVNYFGMVPDISQISLTPVLLAKGKSRLALYGLGAVRDERLHRTFKSGNVKWERPAEDRDSWYNMFVIHQNRTRHAVTQKNYIHEQMLPRFLDLVVWAHEHECLVDLERSAGDGYDIMQPGSSVATSLARGESGPKKVAIFELCGEMYRSTAVQLRSVRPFYMEDVVLSDLAAAEGFEPDDAAAIDRALAAKIDEILARHDEAGAAAAAAPAPARRRPENWADDNAAAAAAAAELERLPLVRLRVDITGFPRMVTSRFGRQFVGRVANPSELLLFHKSRAGGGGAAGSLRGCGGGCEGDAEYLQDQADNAADGDGPPPIEELLSLILADGPPMAVLSEKGLAEAVASFVDKHELSSIAQFFDDQVAAVKAELVRQPGIESAKEADVALDRRAEEIRSVASKARATRRTAAPAGAPGGAAADGARAPMDVDREEENEEADAAGAPEEDDEEDDEARRRTKARPSRAGIGASSRSRAGRAKADAPASQTNAPAAKTKAARGAVSKRPSESSEMDDIVGMLRSQAAVQRAAAHAKHDVGAAAAPRIKKEDDDGNGDDSDVQVIEKPPVAVERDNVAADQPPSSASQPAAAARSWGGRKARS